MSITTKQKARLLARARTDRDFRDLLLRSPAAAARKLRVKLSKPDVQALSELDDKVRRRIDELDKVVIKGIIVWGPRR